MAGKRAAKDTQAQQAAAPARAGPAVVALPPDCRMATQGGLKAELRGRWTSTPSCLTARRWSGSTPQHCSCWCCFGATVIRAAARWAGVAERRSA